MILHPGCFGPGSAYPNTSHILFIMCIQHPFCCRYIVIMTATRHALPNQSAYIMPST
ncbi:hypothetical protein AG1IA_08687 [Rhizoctonia solani AG-1 IA]|uniref:Uncharacterized protein n=1 Tax=Thanatephorus cucumeris (strain AG1-IA) TaxID=983506 RepID=L8WKH1_THACA|nr:hypothetical protein AG1IA_08687 [Rhizoctonia solani AG-1 IA]